MRYSASKNSVTLKTGLGVVQGHWKCRRSINHIRHSIGSPLYSSIWYRFLSYLTLNDIMTLKSGLKVTQGHSNWYHMNAWVRRVSDGHTDGETDILPRHSPRYAYASRGKNHPIFMKFCTQQHILNWMNVTWSKMKKLHWTDPEFDRTYFLFFLFSTAPY